MAGWASSLAGWGPGLAGWPRGGRTNGCMDRCMNGKSIHSTGLLTPIGAAMKINVHGPGLRAGR